VLASETGQRFDRLVVVSRRIGIAHLLSDRMRGVVVVVQGNELRHLNLRESQERGWARGFGTMLCWSGHRTGNIAVVPCQQ
jgi:hypothetical protein